MAALGLRLGADRGQIDDAYRKLIKLHHPDRIGGDGGRAAEINRAYRELRDLPPETPPIRMRPPAAAVRPQPRRRRPFGRILIGLLAITGIILISRSPDFVRSSRPAVASVLPLMTNNRDDSRTNTVTPLEDFDEPLSKGIIDRSAADALRLYKTGTPASLANYSRACGSQFRNHPDIVWFDSCTAFDEAVVLLESRDPLADSGPFNPSAVTAREMGAANLISDDALAADFRLHQIRSRVEFVLLSKLPQ